LQKCYLPRSYRLSKFLSDQTVLRLITFPSLLNLSVQEDDRALIKVIALDH
jgi:hypothetical protein